ncbi:MAG: FAD-dependent oxidoreductase [Gammaproteobacteria bacterium]
MIFDYIVIGAGIAGCALAYELAPSARVCIVEAESRPGFHATGRSAALYAPSYGGEAIRALTRASRLFFDNPPSGFAQYPLLRKRGALHIARSDQLLRLEQMAEGIHKSGGRLTMLSRAESLTHVPLLRGEYVAGAAYDSDAMDIDVAALQQGFLRDAKAQGAVLMTNTRANDIERRNGDWSIVTSEGVIRAPLLINAAGAWADEVGQLCGASPLGFVPLRRTALLVDAPAGVDIGAWPAVIDVDERFYFKPEAAKLLLSPADEGPRGPGDVHPDEIDIALGVDRVQAALDIDVRRVNHAWAGLRTFSSDRVPVVGFDPDVAGLFWCAGQGGYGIQTAPAMARAAAAMLQHQNLPADIRTTGVSEGDLSPFRFVDQSRMRRLP